MSAVLRHPEVQLVPIDIGSLGEVVHLEQRAYEFPWSRGNFVDSLAAGYLMQRLVGMQGELIGYFVAMAGVDEMHLLNITVAPAHEHRGHARRMLGEVVAHARDRSMRQVWLEVRASNGRAARIYARYGFRHIGVRRDYYPAPQRQREDALLMSLELAGASDGLV